jgi:microsomal dipeptidase-like Zn-dependent dipeptidase
MDDEQLLALKGSGGVINIVALDAFVKAEPPEKGTAVDSLRAEFGITSSSEFGMLTDEQRDREMIAEAKLVVKL